MRLDKLTIKTQEALSEAVGLASDAKHTEVAPVHLLQAFLAQEQGAVGAILQRIGVNAGQLSGLLAETAAKHFAGQDDLLLLHIDTDCLGDGLKWEPSRGGALFPHLYAPLDPKAAVSVVPLPLGADGEHQFPF